MVQKSDKNLQNIKANAVLAFESNVNEYVKKFEELCKGAPNGVPKLDEMETLMDDLREKTRKNYLDMSSQMINRLDEGKVIESKKANTGRSE